MQSRLPLASTCLAGCLLVEFQTLLEAVVALSTENDLEGADIVNLQVVSMSELTCRRCGISNPQELDVSCLIVDTSLVSCIAQVHKSILSRRAKCHGTNSKKNREKETAHLTQVEWKGFGGFCIILFPGKCS